MRKNKLLNQPNTSEYFNAQAGYWALHKTSIDPSTGNKIWTPPNKDTWESIHILSFQTPMVLMKSPDIIPPEKRLPGVYYCDNMQHLGSMLIYTPSIYLFAYTHFGNDFRITSIIQDCLNECGVDSHSIGVYDHLYFGDKRCCSIAGFKRGGYVWEIAGLTEHHNQTTYDSIMPPLVQNCGVYRNQYIGVSDVHPSFDIETFISKYEVKTEDQLTAFEDGISGEKVLNKWMASIVPTSTSNSLMISLQRDIDRYRDDIELGNIPSITEAQYKDLLLQLEIERYKDTTS